MSGAMMALMNNIQDATPPLSPSPPAVYDLDAARFGY